jgi:NAD(P)-dependent dehydrogenase (short-subunit alcohol dehydrogenase family)
MPRLADDFGNHPGKDHKMQTILRLLAVGVLATLAAPALGALDPDRPTVLITGANRGIGLEFVRQYAERGYNVIATARKPAAAEELNALAAAHEFVVVEQLDVTDHARIDELATEYAEQPIDILLSNAAITPRYRSAFQRVKGVDFDMARQSFEVNALAPLKLAQAFMPHVAASEQKKIVAMSSKAGSFAEGPKMPMMYSYRASKAALDMFMYTLSFETVKKGITTVLLSPGSVNTTPGMKMPDAIEPEESVGKLLAVIDGLGPENNGQFLNYEDGRLIPW